MIENRKYRINIFKIKSNLINDKDGQQLGETTNYE